MPGVHPQAEHEQEALQGILAEMCQLADKMHGDVGCKAGHPQPGEHPLYQAKHPAAGPSDTTPICMELEKMNAMQPMSASVKITRPAMSQGEVRGFCSDMLSPEP